MKRRSVLLGLAGGGVLSSQSMLWAPNAFGQNPHNEYFSKLNESLKLEGPGRPVMIIDSDRMNYNIDLIASSVGPQKKYRVVVKSLPSLPMLSHVMERAKTNALMVFHQPFLSEIAEKLPDSEVLLGKPLPVNAVRKFYASLKRSSFEPEKKIQWLIDSQDRLLQYLQLSRELGVSMKFNFEIDVGLRRGGYEAVEQLAISVATIKESRSAHSISGLMGYEPHLTGKKARLEDQAVADVLNQYEGFKQKLMSSGLDESEMTFNGAGSHTLKIYEKDMTMNDLSAGSAVVKPTDFDTFHLLDNQPACYIAAPILKRYDGNPYVSNPSVNMERLYYIYGGYWKAQIESPSEIGDPIYQSTNQSPLTTSRDINLSVDDYVFYRPTQSEHVMLQFGDLLTVSDGALQSKWPVFHQTG